jgi:hypothetical protein
MATASEIMAAAQTAAATRPLLAARGSVVLSMPVLKRKPGALTNE